MLNRPAAILEQRQLGTTHLMTKNKIHIIGILMSGTQTYQQGQHAL